MENTCLALQKNSTVSFSHWSSQNSAWLESELLTAGVDFLTSQTERLKTQRISVEVKGLDILTS